MPVEITEATIREVRAPGTEGLTAELSGIDLAKRFADMYRSGAQGAEMGCDSAQALAVAIDGMVAALSQPPSEQEAEPVAYVDQVDLADVKRQGRSEMTTLWAEPYVEGHVPLFASPVPALPETGVGTAELWSDLDDLAELTLELSDNATDALDADDRALIDRVCAKLRAHRESALPASPLAKRGG